MNTAKLRFVAACLFTLPLVGCSDIVKKDELTAGFKQLANAINQVGQRAKNAQEKVTDCEYEIRRLKTEVSEISDLKKEVTSISSSISSLKREASEISSLQSEISRLKKEVRDLESRIKHAERE